LYAHLRLHAIALLAFWPIASAYSQQPSQKQADTTGRANSPFSRNEADLPKGPAPRLSEHPDLSGYWIPSKKDRPTGNLGKDLPGFKLPFTPSGEAALKYNLEHTVDPEAICIVGGLPRHNASGLPFQLLQGADHAVFLYWYTTYRLVPFDGRKHAEPDLDGVTGLTTLDSDRNARKPAVIIAIKGGKFIYKETVNP